MDTSPPHRIYYDNAAKFAEFTGGPIFRGEGLRPPNLGDLADAALEARRTQTSLSQGHQFILRDLARTSAIGDSLAQFVRSIAAGQDPPEIPHGLPRGLQRYLRDLSLAANGTAKIIKLVPCAVEAVCMRLSGTPLSQEANDVLTELEHSAKMARTYQSSYTIWPTARNRLFHKGYRTACGHS